MYRFIKHTASAGRVWCAVLTLAACTVINTPAYAQKFIRPGSADLNQESNASIVEVPNAAGGKGNAVDSLGPNQKKSLDNQVINIASINGLLVGYGFYCSINPENIKVLHNKYFETVARINNPEYQEMAREEYEKKVKIARQYGPSYSGTNCEFIIAEYKKIMNLVASNSDKLFDNNDAVIRKRK